MGTGKKMRGKTILFIVNALYAGAGKILLFVAGACARAGWKVTVATLYDDSVGDYHVDGVNFINFDIPMKTRIWRLQALRIIRKRIKGIQPTIICAFISDVVFMTRLATLGLKTFFVAAERGDPYILPSKWIIPVKWAYRNSDYSVFQLKGAQDFFDEKVQKNSVIIPNPYSTGECVKPYNGTRNKTVVSVGRFVEQKGYDVLLNAFRIFHDAHPDYRLIIYGDGPLKDNYMEQIKQLNLDDSVFLPGFIHNIPKTIREDGIFVLSSRFEGIPNALIEAMSVGIPTISTDCSPGGPRFLTNNGRRGILVPVDDTEAIANAMSIVADDNEKALRYSLLGLEIIDELNPQRIEEKWLRVFDNAYQMA